MGKHRYEVAIIGGGLAGLVSSIHLAKVGISVVLFEKKAYPFHKVCGEYVSKEVLDYLEKLGISLSAFSLPSINTLLLSHLNGSQSRCELPLGGVGISRFTLDHLLYQEALAQGVVVLEKTPITAIQFDGVEFSLKSTGNQHWKADTVLGAYGKRANLDRVLQRNFFQQKSSYVGIKYHRHAEFPDDVIALHLFQGGYCGISQIEAGQVNMCYLVHGSQLEKSGSIPHLEQQVLSRNPHLHAFIQNSRSIYKKPLVISNISFTSKAVVDQHILMVGDTAGLITPLCGNGMAMAIHAAKLASEVVVRFLKQDISRPEMESIYREQWKSIFQRRLWVGKSVQPLFLQPTFSQLPIGFLRYFPKQANKIIQQTHGQPF